MLSLAFQVKRMCDGHLDFIYKMWDKPDSSRKLMIVAHLLRLSTYAACRIMPHDPRVGPLRVRVQDSVRTALGSGGANGWEQRPCYVQAPPSSEGA